MSVILVTGQPGSGKTAHVVDMLAHDEQFAGRPVFVMGIPDLTLPVIPCPPVDQWTELRQSPEDVSLELAYFTFPENALVVIDEAQRVYRPRPVGSRVPPEVAAFETHRHLGIDFILLTQHAGLIDSNIRKLIGRHIHIRVTALARYRYEWTELGDPESASSRDLAARSKYVLPKRAFALYKSSELHTKIRNKIPIFVWVFIVATLLAIGLGIFAAYRVNERANGTKAPGAVSHGKVTQPASVEVVKDYHEARKPRIAGLAHTAPVYDSVTEVTDAPFPAGCMLIRPTYEADRCRCIDQQGNNYATTDAMCRHIVRNGIFKDWGKVSTDPAQPERAATAGKLDKPSSVSPSAPDTV